MNQTQIVWRETWTWFVGSYTYVVLARVSPVLQRPLVSTTHQHITLSATSPWEAP